MNTEVRTAPVQERSMTSLSRILDAAADLLAEREPGRITMATIGDRAGLSKAAVYRYFTDRPALMRAVIEERSVPLLDYLNAAAPAGVHAVARRYAVALTNDPVLKAVLVTGYSAVEVGDYAVEIEADLAEVVAETGPERDALRVLLRTARAVAELAVLTGNDVEDLMGSLHEAFQPAASS